MLFFKKKIKRNIGSKNGNTLTLIKLEFHKEIKDSNYNSRLGILGIVALGCATAAALTGIVLLSPLLQPRHHKHSK